MNPTQFDAGIGTLVYALGWALLDFVWQGALIGAIAAALLRGLRDARPQSRYAVACVAMLACLMLPIIGVWSALPGASAGSITHGNTLFSAPAFATGMAIVAPNEAWPPLLREQLPWLVTAWALGAGLLSLRMALGLAWVRRVGRNSPDIIDARWQARLTELASRLGLRRAVGLRVSGEIESPVAAGWWRPVVLVPAALIAQMPAGLLEALLAHELAHIRRHDYLVNLAQSAVEALLFYHPVVWWLSRRVRIEREQIADDLAAQAIGEPRRLALALQELDRLQFSPSALALAANGGNLMSRIQRLIRPSGRSMPLNWRVALPILALAAVCVTVYAQGPSAAGKASATQTPNSTASTASIVAGSNAVVVVNADAATDVLSNEVITNDPSPDTSVDDLSSESTVSASSTIAPVAPVAPVSMTLAMAAPAPTSLAAPMTPIAPVAPVAPIAPASHRTLQVTTERNGDGYALVHAGDADVTFSGNTRDLSEVEKLRAKIGGDFLWFRRDGKSYIVRDPTLVAEASAAWKPAEPVNEKMQALSRQMEVHSRTMDALSQKMETASRLGDPMAADMERTSAQMEAMSARQEQLSGQQEALSAKREALSARIESLSRTKEAEQSIAERDALQVQMNQLHAQMQPLTARMQQLGEQMRAQSEKMDAAHKPMEDVSRQMEAAAKPMQALGQQMEVLGKQQEQLSLQADRKVKSLIDQAKRSGQAVPVGQAAPQ